MAIQFIKAERKQAKARIAFCSPAGGGKTHSSLLIAAGLGGKVAVIDTENGSASLEAGKPGIPDFDVLTLSAPFTVEKYIEGMKAAEAGGYDVIILDSLSHAWQGTGGLLEQVDMKTKASKSQNSYAAWRDITPMHNAFIEAILQSKCHVIATMRTKSDFVLEKDEKTGRTAPKKVGLAPVQREGMDYEFTIVFDIDQASHVALASKDRTSLFDGKPFVPTVETGKAIAEWIMSGVAEPMISAEQSKEIMSLVAMIGTDLTKVEEWVKGKYGVSIAELTAKQADEAITLLRARANAPKPPVTPPTTPNAPTEPNPAPQTTETAPVGTFQEVGTHVESEPVPTETISAKLEEPVTVHNDETVTVETTVEDGKATATAEVTKADTVLDYMARAKACADQMEAVQLVAAMTNENASKAKLGAVKGVLASRGFEVV